MWLEVGAVAVRGTANRALGWMGSCLALVLINAMEERAPKRKVVPREIRAKPLYVHFPRDRGRGGRAGPAPNSAAVEVVECLAVEAAGRRRASRAAVEEAVRLPIRPCVGTSSFCRAWTTSPAA